MNRRIFQKGAYLCFLVSMFPNLYVPRSYASRSLCSPVLCSPASMFPITYVPRSLCSPVLCSPVSMFPSIYAPRYLCSPVPIFLYPLNCVVVQALQHVIRLVTYRCQEHRHIIISNSLN